MLWFLKKILGWTGNTINTKQCKEIMCFVWKAEKYKPKQQIIEFDKIYHHTLKKLWYTWSFWEILKQNPKEVKNIQEIWDLHKLRNSLVHELRDHDERFLNKQAKSYKNIVEKFVKEVTK